MPLIRGHHSFDDHFTQIPNDWLRDKRISLGAKGLLAQLLSHSPGWRISQESLGRDNGVGRDAIRTLINELLEAGYLMRSEERERGEKGYLGGYTYTTQDPTQDNPTQDNPLLKKTITKKNNLKNNERIYSESEFDSFWSNYPKKVDKGAAASSRSSGQSKSKTRS
jgi:biotin operon repressor